MQYSGEIEGEKPPNVYTVSVEGVLTVAYINQCSHVLSYQLVLLGVSCFCLSVSVIICMSLEVIFNDKFDGSTSLFKVIPPK